MEYQKITNLLDSIPNQLSKFRTKNWIEVNDQSRGAKNYNVKVQFIEYSDAYILVKGRKTITGAEDDAATRQADERNKGVTLKNFAPFINCKTETNNTEIDSVKDIDIVMPMFNLTTQLYNIVIIIQKHLEVYGNNAKMNQMKT